MTTTAVRPPVPAGDGAPSPSQAPPPGRRRAGRRPPSRMTRLLRLRTVPGRLRALAAVGLLAVIALFAVSAVAINNARDGLEVIGHDAGPQVVATGDLYFALSDMDAQVADILLIGRDTKLGVGRQAALSRYEQRRAEASRALLQAAQLAGEDATEQRTVRLVIEGLGRYERMAAQAMLLDTQAAHAAGPPPQRVTEIYRQATDLMKVELLPKAYNLTLESGTTVRKTYENKHASVLSGRTYVIVSGMIVLVILAGVQFYMYRRFRRIINPALGLATLVTIGLTVAAATMLGAQADHLRAAKKDGFDSILGLSRARAISNSAYADESRFLLDPGRADTYEQVYLDKSQAIFYVEAGNLDKYYPQMDAVLPGYSPDRDPSFLGFFGDEARNISSDAQIAAMRKVLAGYQQYQRDDQKMRALAGQGKRNEAIASRMGRAPGSSIHDFEQYDKALSSLTNLHRQKFDDAVKSGDDGLSGWNWILPVATIGLAALILAGVRPRLSEYR